jgi:hypothetical protein
MSNDPHGSKLICAICDRLPVDAKFNEDKFGRLRRVAQEGRQALEAILIDEPASDPNFENLVTRVYTWATSLRDYRGSVSPLPIAACELKIYIIADSRRVFSSELQAREASRVTLYVGLLDVYFGGRFLLF